MRVVNRLGNVSIMIVAGLLLSGAALTSTPPSGAQEVTVVGVFVDPDSGSRVVMLEGKRDKRTRESFSNTHALSGNGGPLI